MKEIRPFTAKMQGKVGGWVLDGAGHAEKRWESETYGSAIW